MSQPADKNANLNKMKTCIHDARVVMDFALNQMPVTARLDIDIGRDSDASVIFAGNLATQHFNACMARQPIRPKGR